MLHIPVIEEYSITWEDLRDGCLERLQRKIKMEPWQAKGKTLTSIVKTKIGKQTNMNNE